MHIYLFYIWKRNGTERKGTWTRDKNVDYEKYMYTAVFKTI